MHWKFILELYMVANTKVRAPVVEDNHMSEDSESDYF